MRIPTKLLTLAAAGLVAAAATSAPATAAPKKQVRTAWAPADTATIHPGVQMYTEGAQCTANFVFTDTAGTTYVGYAAHCAGTGEATDTNGCHDSASFVLTVNEKPAPTIAVQGARQQSPGVWAICQGEAAVCFLVLNPQPLIPAQAGTQGRKPLDFGQSPWVPAFVFGPGGLGRASRGAR